MYHVANETKNHYRKLEAYNDAVAKLQEKHAKGFVDKKEQSRMEATVEDARKKKDAAILYIGVFVDDIFAISL